jgi:putative tricarboxylic transport membrane protein
VTFPGENFAPAAGGMSTRYDKVSSLVWLVGSIAIILGSLAYSFGSWSHPGPAFLSLLCGIIMAALSLIIFVQAIMKDKGEAKEKEAGSFFTARWSKLVAALIILFAYALLLETFGFLMMTFVFMLFTLKVVEPTKWRTAVIVSVLATAVSYFLFESWLKVPMPRGFWPDLFR